MYLWDLMIVEMPQRPRQCRRSCPSVRPSVNRCVADGAVSGVSALSPAGRQPSRSQPWLRWSRAAHAGSPLPFPGDRHPAVDGRLPAPRTSGDPRRRRAATDAGRETQRCAGGSAHQPQSGGSVGRHRRRHLGRQHPGTYQAILQVYISTLQAVAARGRNRAPAVLTTQAPGYTPARRRSCRVDLGRFARGSRPERTAADPEVCGGIGRAAGGARGMVRPRTGRPAGAPVRERLRRGGRGGTARRAASLIEADLPAATDSAIVGELPR